MKNKIKKSIIVIALHHFWFRARIDVELLQRATNRESFEKKLAKNRYTGEVVVWFFFILRLCIYYFLNVL